MRISLVERQFHAWLALLVLLVVAILISLAVVVTALYTNTGIEPYITTNAGTVTAVSVEVVHQ